MSAEKLNRLEMFFSPAASGQTSLVASNLVVYPLSHISA